MATDKQLRILYNEAFKFLETKIGREALEKKLDYHRHYKAESMEDVFWHLLQSLCNKRGMPATIGDIDTLEPYLFDFVPGNTKQCYGDDWKRLFRTIQENHTPPGPMNIKNENSYWVIFCKGILSGAGFLSRFESFDAFDGFVASFNGNEISRAALPILLEHEIYGVGFALACDWLKECGYNQYGKPDVHTQGILFRAGILDHDDQYECFKTMSKIGSMMGQPTAVVDKVLWWIGSGKYVDNGEKVTRQGRIFVEGLKRRE